MVQIAEAIITFGLIPILVGFLVFSIWNGHKTERRRQERDQDLIEKMREDGLKRNEKILDLVMQNTKSIEKVRTQTSGIHTKEEEAEGAKINALLTQGLDKLLVDTCAAHASYLAYHNGGRLAGGRFMPKMSMMYEAVSSEYDKPIISEFQGLPRTYLSKIGSALEKNGYQYIDNVNEVKESDPAVYHICKPRGINSYMVNAVKDSNKNILGFIVLEFSEPTNCSGDRPLQRKLRDMAIKFSGALELKEV